MFNFQKSILHAQEIFNWRLSQEKPSIPPSQPQPSPKVEQQYFQNITPNFQNIFQHNTPPTPQRMVKLNQSNPCLNVTSQNPPHGPNTNSFQAPPKKVSSNINPQGHTPHIDHSIQDNIDD